MESRNNFPVVLVVLDGWGIAPEGRGNAIKLAKTPNLDSLFASYPHGQLQAAGTAVGLPEGEAGNSEVGHLNIGSGRIVYQDLQRINLTIADGTFFQNEAFKAVCEQVKANKSRLHLMGLVGLGVVHSSLEHLYALLWLAKENGVKEVYLHLFTDGRDSPPKIALEVIAQIEEKLKSVGVGRIATIIGRYYAMDRDNRWERVRLAYEALVLGIGNRGRNSQEIIENSYKQLVNDEFIVPSVIVDEQNNPLALIEEGDGVIFFNFREDRARELTKAFILPNFNSFERKKDIKNLIFTTLTEYDKGLPVSVAFPKQNISLPLAKVVSEKGMRQLHISETEKYAHVTYFLNGGREDPFVGEDRIHIPSAKVPTYDLKPEMSAEAITEITLQRLHQRIYDLIIINFANADMVSHSGKIEPTIKALEVIDKCLGKIAKAVLALGDTLIITADHGNAEEMINPQNAGPDTEHSKNPVPFLAINDKLRRIGPQILLSGILADVAPTVLALMGIAKPFNMSGRNLLKDVL